VVLSASANNEGHPLQLKNYRTYVMKSNKYSEDEYRQWCDQNEYVSTDPVMEEALFWSGGVPLELDEFHRTHAESPEAKLAKFVDDRIRYISGIHAKFTDDIARLTGARMSNLMECIVRLSLDIEAPAQDIGMDKQLMCIVSNKICALNPLCQEVLLACHPGSVQDPLNVVASTVLSDVRYENDTKGRILEHYLINMTRLQKTYFFVTEAGDRKSKKSTFSGKISKIVRFKGHELPAASSFSMLQSTLFITYSSQYPGLDYFIWDSQQGKLFAVKVTVRRPMSKHKKPNSELLSSWAALFEVEHVLVLWVVPADCVTTGKLQENNYIVLLNSLERKYPALANLQLKPGDVESSSVGEHEDDSDHEGAGGASAAVPVPNEAKRSKRRKQ
jgi:hypothetical protein